MHRMYGLLLAFLIVACTETGPGGLVRIEVSRDSAAFEFRDSLVLVATAYDDRGNELGDDGIEWSTDDPLLSVHNGIVKAQAPTTGRVVVSRGNATKTATVWAQPRAMFIRLGFSVDALAPGATFLASPATWDTTRGAVAYKDYGGSLAKGWDVLRSSNPGVVDWVSFHSEPANHGWRLTAFAPGEAVVMIVSGGLRDSLIVRVEQPQLVKLDSTWTGSQYTVCGIAANGEAWCRGPNHDGELGTRTASWYQPCCTLYQQGSVAPVAVDTDQRFETLTVSSSTWCGITLAKRVYCWGRGDGSPLGGIAPTTDCLWYSYPGNSYQHRCSFVPLLADRELNEVLRFDELRSQAGSMCGHVFARGPTESAATVVDEYWCWGGSYGGPPQARSGFFN